MLEVKAQVCLAVELAVTLDQVRFEQGHTAANIAADQVWVDHSLGHKGGADRAAFAGVQIREADRQAHAFKLCRRIELAERLALDPALGRGEKAHIGFSQCVHASFLPRKAGIRVSVGSAVLLDPEFRIPHSAFRIRVVPEVGIAPTSPPLQGGANLPQLLGVNGCPAR